MKRYAQENTSSGIKKVSYSSLLTFEISEADIFEIKADGKEGSWEILSPLSDLRSRFFLDY